MTLQLSLLPEDNTTSLPQDFPARIYQDVTPTGEGWKVNEADYSFESATLFATYSQSLSYWKTSQLCLLPEADETWELYSESFPSAGTMQNGKLYRHRAWVRLTYEKEYLLLPTPTASDGTVANVIGENDTYQLTKNGTIRRHYGNNNASLNLGRLVKFLPTPKASDRPGIVATQKGQTQRVSAEVLGGNKDRILNPQFVEWMMGFPENHTLLND